MSLSPLETSWVAIGKCRRAEFDRETPDSRTSTTRGVSDEQLAQRRDDRLATSGSQSSSSAR
jgi:hypothetical protein